jgi:hypothetical protein
MTRTIAGFIRALGKTIVLIADRLDGGGMGGYEESVLASTPKPILKTGQTITFTGPTIFVTAPPPPMTWPTGTQVGGGGGGSGTSGSGGDGGPPPPPPPPPAPPNYKEVDVDKKWPDCGAARSDLQGMDGSAGHPFISSFAWNIHYQMSNQSAKQLPDKTWQYLGNVNITSIDMTITLPAWANIPNDPATQNAWNQMLDAMRQHEEGHIPYVNDVAGPLNGQPVVGVGSTQDAAMASAKAQLDQKIAGANDQILAKENAYDSATDHGRNQAAVGGKNIELKCP